jgi:hypothetical protein
MTKRQGPVYEITFFVAEEVVLEQESWFSNKAQASLSSPGVRDFQLFSIGDDKEGRKGRVCQFIFDDNDSLDEFIDGIGADITAEATSLFGEQIDASERVLREDESYESGSAEVADCLNCGAHLRGQYCGHCGQRSGSRLISLWELVRDAFGDLFELDSRLWNTLVPLMIRPGLLTHDYLQGRRARYMPPFRMYLVLSVLFFLVAFFDPQEKLGLLFEPEPTPAEDILEEDITTDSSSGEPLSEVDEIKQEILEELAAEGILAADGEFPEEIVDDDGNVIVTLDGDSEDCSGIEQSDLDDMPGWISRRLTLERVKRMCERVQLDDGQTLLDELFDNVPAALIILIPIMALVLKGLYPLSRRYYVEHLLFFVHFHAFFFLILTLQILFSRLMTLLSAPETFTALTLVASSFYIPVYLFVSMRRVYGQGRAVTFFKYIILTLAYTAGFTATMLGAFAIAAFSI